MRQDVVMCVYSVTFVFIIIEIGGIVSGRFEQFCGVVGFGDGGSGW